MRPINMRRIPRSLWDESIRPRLRSAGLDVCRYPPREWTEDAFDSLLQVRPVDAAAGPSPAEDFLYFCTHHRHASHAQLLQDLFVRWHLEDKRGGYFVEFGATDGIKLSNTRHLEHALGWHGILAEPARRWHEDLHSNRDCTIDTRCVWSHSDKTLAFKEVPAGELSTIESFAQSDGHASEREVGEVYEVATVSLNDLLADHGAPDVIDYLSVDTEGSELAILEQVDFSKYRFRVITVEHNYTPAREQLHELLAGHGYERTFEQFSQWDDWYVHPDS